MVLRTGVAQEQHIRDIDKQIRAIFAEGTPPSLSELMTQVRTRNPSGGSNHWTTMRLVKALDFPEKAEWLARYRRYLRQRRRIRKPYRKATAHLVTPEEQFADDHLPGIRTEAKEMKEVMRHKRAKDSWAYEAIQQALEWGATRIVVDAINREVRATWSATKEGM